MQRVAQQKKATGASAKGGAKEGAIDAGASEKGKQRSKGRGNGKTKTASPLEASSTKSRASSGGPATASTSSNKKGAIPAAPEATTTAKAAAMPPQRRAQPKRRRLRFERDFGFGEQGEIVERLQRVLLAEDFIRPQAVTGYFGRETKDALIGWQRKYGILPSGYFGPISRASMNRESGVKRMQQSIVAHVRMSSAESALAPIGLVVAVMAAVALWVARNRIAVLGLWDRMRAILRRGEGDAPIVDFDAIALTGVTTDPAGRGNDQALTQAGEESLAARPEYERRVELRRTIAGLQNNLGQAEDQLRIAIRQLKRERERADRAEALYVEQKAAMQAMEAEVSKLRAEVRVAKTSVARRR